MQPNDDHGPVPEPLKNFVDAELVGRLGTRIAAVFAAFRRDDFVAGVAAALPDLELKERMALMADELARRLPEAFPEAVLIIVAAAELEEPPISGWEDSPLSPLAEGGGQAWDGPPGPPRIII